MSTSEYPVQRFGGPRRWRLRADARARAIPADLWAVGALVVVAVVIRILTIDNQSLWMDEALTAYEAQLPFGAMIHTVAHVETTPPLYFVVIWAWAHLFGTGDVALRSISTLSGIALVPITFLSARELVSRTAGVMAAAFVTVNPFLIWYSQEARAYMLLAALTGASFLWFIRARRDASYRNLAWWAVCSSLAVMTHFFAGFLVAPEALWLLWVWRTRAVAIAIGVVAAAQAAMVPFAFTDTSHGVGWIAAVPRIARIQGFLLEWGVSTIFRRGTLAEGLVGWSVLFVLVLLLLAFGGDRQVRHGAMVAAVIAGCVLLLPLALGFVGEDYFLSRNVIPAFVPLATVVAAACAAPRRRVLGGALAIGLLALFSVAAIRVQTHPYLERPDWRAAARLLGPAEVPRAILAADGATAHPLKIYLPHVSWVQLPNRRVRIDEIDVVGSKGVERLVSKAAPVAGLLPAGPPPVGSAVPRSVAPRGARLISRVRVDNWTVARFALRHPITVSINQLTLLAPRFFRRTPVELLVFTQQPGR